MFCETVKGDLNVLFHFFWGGWLQILLEAKARIVLKQTRDTDEKHAVNTYKGFRLFADIMLS